MHITFQLLLDYIIIVSLPYTDLAIAIAICILAITFLLFCIGYVCCGLRNLSWFYRELSQSTQDIEVRICTDQAYSDEAILVASLELYIQ